MKENLIEVTIINKQALDALTAGLSGIDKDSAIKSGLSKGGEVIKRGGMERLKNRMRAGPGGKTGNLLRSLYGLKGTNRECSQVLKKGKRAETIRTWSIWEQ